MTIIIQYLGFGHEHMTITPSSFLLLCHVSKDSCVLNVRTTVGYVSDKMITDYHLWERRREGRGEERGGEERGERRREEEIGERRREKERGERGEERREGRGGARERHSKRTRCLFTSAHTLCAMLTL